jgi:hypothetical protein
MKHIFFCLNFFVGAVLFAHGHPKDSGIVLRWINEHIVRLSYNDDIPVYFQKNWRASNGSIVMHNGDKKITRKSQWRDTILVIDSMTYIGENKGLQMIQITHHEIDFTKRRILRLNLAGWGDTLENAVFMYDDQYRLERMIRKCHPGFTAAHWKGEQFRFEYGEHGILQSVYCHDGFDTALPTEQFKLIRFDGENQWLLNEAHQEHFEFKGGLGKMVLEYGVKLDEKRSYHAVYVQYRVGDTLITLHGEALHKDSLLNGLIESRFYTSDRYTSTSYFEERKYKHYPDELEYNSHVELHYSPPKGESWTIRFYDKDNKLVREVYEDGLGP